MGGEIVLLKNKFKDYSSKDEEDGRYIEDFAKLYSAATKDLDQRLNILLCGNTLDDLATDDNGFSSSERGNHESKLCDGVVSETEHPICKCMFYYDRNVYPCSNCKCGIKNPWTNKSEDFEVIDYEYPMPYEHRLSQIGKVDIVLRDKNTDEVYGVEVKPPRPFGKKPNQNTISTMVAEILTYTSVLEKGGELGRKNGKVLKPAIAFFRDSIQYDKFQEYRNAGDSDFINLFKTIKVFTIERSIENAKTNFWFVPIEI